MPALPLFGTSQPLAKNSGSMFSTALPPLYDEQTGEPISGGAAKAAAPYQSTPFVQDKTPAAAANTAGAQPKSPMQQKAQAAYYGVQAAGGVTPTPDAGEAAVGALGAGVQGALMGASVGGVPGAVAGGVTGLVLGGLNAFMGMKSAQRANDKAEALRADAIRMQKEEIARDEKWRVQNRLDSLEEARYQRRKFAMQSAYEASQAQGQKMMAMIANNQQLKEKYAKMGFN